jgi:hypothetical protein
MFSERPNVATRVGGSEDQLANRRLLDNGEVTQFLSSLEAMV